MIESINEDENERERGREGGEGERERERKKRVRDSMLTCCMAVWLYGCMVQLCIKRAYV